MELHRVLGDEVASMRELKTALSACLHGGDGEAGGDYERRTTTYQIVVRHWAANWLE